MSAFRGGCRTLLAVFAIVCTLNFADVFGQQGSTKDQLAPAEKPLVIEIPDLEINFSSMLNDNERRRRGEFVSSREIDVDSDGIHDIAIQTRFGRGPLSTYFTEYRMVGINGTRFLREGKPVENGDKIFPAEILKSVDSANLCSVGASLRFPERSGDDFCSGPWWNVKNKGLALVKPAGEKLKAGFVMISVDKRGTLTVGESELAVILDKSIAIEYP